MTGTHLLDAAIGIVFVILSFSLVASALNEALATALNWRGRMLRRGLFRLLERAGDSDLVDLPFPGRGRIARAELTQDVLADPAIRVLHGPRGLAAQLWDRIADRGRTAEERAAARAGRLPSAIPAESFARALVEALVRRVDLSAIGLAAPADLDTVRASVEEMGREADRILGAADGVLAALPLGPAMKSRLRDVVGRLSVTREIRARIDRLEGVPAEIEAELRGAVHQAETRLYGVLTELADWFDRAMERVSGWYVRRSRLVLFILGLAMAASVNVDLTRLAPRVMADADLRGALLDRAEDRLANGLPAGRPGREPADGAEGADQLIAEIGAAHGRLRDLPVSGGAGFGRSCFGSETWLGCAWQTFRATALVSWIVIALGCMMGGQFWYDFLGAVMRFKPVARRPA